MKKELGGLSDTLKKTLREKKSKIGTELFNRQINCFNNYRFMRGFIKTKDNVEENEKISHQEFLFKKLKF